MNKYTNKNHKESNGSAVFGVVMAVVVLVAFCHFSEKIKEQDAESKKIQDMKRQVEKYIATCPNYVDSLRDFDMANEEMFIQFNKLNSNQKDSVRKILSAKTAQRIGLVESKCRTMEDIRAFIDTLQVQNRITLPVEYLNEKRRQGLIR